MKEIQNPHLNQGGKAAAKNRYLLVVIFNSLYESMQVKLEIDLRRGTMNPPNRNISIRTKKPQVDAVTIVRKIEAMKRHMDVDARCTANRTRN